MKLRLIAAILAPLWLANCATVVEGTDQNVLINSDPAGASCKLKRDGGEVGGVAATPASVRISKSKDPIAVTCRKEGYLDTTGHLASGFQGMTFGNVLLGGFIGVAIDAGSGAMHEYPESIVVYLTPESFPSAEERDAYFDKRIATLQEEAEAAKKEIVRTCGEESGENKGCKSQQAKVDKQRDLQIQALESQRSNAKVSG